MGCFRGGFKSPISVEWFIIIACDLVFLFHEMLSSAVLVSSGYSWVYLYMVGCVKLRRFTQRCFFLNINCVVDVKLKCLLILREIVLSLTKCYTSKIVCTLIFFCKYALTIFKLRQFQYTFLRNDKSEQNINIYLCLWCSRFSLVFALILLVNRECSKKLSSNFFRNYIWHASSGGDPMSDL